MDRAGVVLVSWTDLGVRAAVLLAPPIVASTPQNYSYLPAPPIAASIAHPLRHCPSPPRHSRPYVEAGPFF